MKKILLCLCTTLSLMGAPKAVVFDFGGVLAHPKREIVVQFLQESLHLSSQEMQEAAQEKNQAAIKGMTEVEFWKGLADKKNIALPERWEESFFAVLNEAIGVDAEMYAMIGALKKEGVRVGLLSDIDERPARLLKSFKLYEPFDPCLLSCEMGVQKPSEQAYQILLQKLGMEPGDVLFIDDQKENVKVALEKGLDAILFESPSQIKKVLQERGLLEYK